MISGVRTLALLAALHAGGCNGSRPDTGGGPDGATPRPDAETGAPSDASTSIDAAPSVSASTACEWGVFNEATLDIKLMAAEANEGSGCVGAPCAAEFSVKEHRLDVPPTKTDLWYPRLLGSTPQSTSATLDFAVVRGWDVTWRAGEKLRVRRVINQMDCPTPGNQQEYVTQTFASLRDEQGKLLAISAPDIPLAGGGRAVVDSSFLPEVVVSWKPLDCPAYQGPGVGDTGGGHRTVAIHVKTPDGTSEAAATWGRAANLKIGGENYVLAVNDSWMFANGQGCGHARLVIYRAGYLEKVPLTPARPAQPRPSKRASLNLLQRPVDQLHAD